MDKETLYIITTNPLIRQFLNEESYHYKYLFRDKNYVKTIEKLAKEKYKMTAQDKIEKLKDNINLINAFISVIE